MLFNIFKKRIMADCGHETLEKDKITAFGTTCGTKVLIVNGKTDYCHRCLEKMAIRCALCGEVIFIGDPITLYSPRVKCREMPDYAVLHKNENDSYVCCLRSQCAEIGADRAGFWYPPGKVMRVPSSFKMTQNGEMVFIGDLGDPKETVKCL